MPRKPQGPKSRARRFFILKKSKIKSVRRKASTFDVPGKVKGKTCPLFLEPGIFAIENGEKWTSLGVNEKKVDRKKHSDKKVDKNRR